MKAFRYWIPTEVIFEAGCVDRIRDRCRALGERPLIVTGRSSAKRTGALERVRSQFPTAAVFDHVDENPTTETVARGADVCRKNDCSWVLAVGGGSPIDAAKAIAVMATNDGPCSAYFGTDLYPRPNLPVVAVPTTAGTGSEVTPYSVLVDLEQHSKRTLTGRGLFPVVAFLDPTLSVSMPRSVTINTGLDALSQAMEGMVSLRATPLGDTLALETCRLVREWLPRAAAEPGSVEARGQMLYAAMLSGCIIAHSGTTLVHGMGYYFTLENGLAHGLANGLLLAPVFAYNAQHVPEKVAALATALGFPADPVPEDASWQIVRAIYAILESLGVPPAAREAGVDPARLRSFAEQIFPDRSRFRNQPGNPSLDEVLGFFEKACTGNC